MGDLASPAWKGDVLKSGLRTGRSSASSSGVPLSSAAAVISPGAVSVGLQHSADVVVHLLAAGGTALSLRKM